MSKRSGRQRDTAFTTFNDVEFRELFYERRHQLDAATRLRIEKEAKARGIRNVQRRGG